MGNDGEDRKLTAKTYEVNMAKTVQNHFIGAVCGGMQVPVMVSAILIDTY